MHQRPLRVRPSRSGSDILDAWVVRTYLTAELAFPAAHRSSAIIALRSVRLNPVEVAILTLAEKTAALAALMEAAAAGPDRAAPQSFTQTLAGCVDAAVSGGVANYAPLLSGEFRVAHPEIADDLAGSAEKEGLISHGLLPALAAHAHVLVKGVAVHAQKCPADNLPLHEHLVAKLPGLLNLLREWGVEGVPE